MENNRNTIIGVMLISMLIMALFWNQAEKQRLEDEANPQTEETVTNNEAVQNENTEESTTNTAIEIVEETNLTPEDSSTLLSEEALKAKTKYGDLYAKTTGEASLVNLENDLLEIAISTKGAQVEKVRLKEFTTSAKEPLILIDKSQELGFSFANSKNNLINTSEFYYDIEKTENGVNLKADFGNNAFIEHRFALKEGSYLVDYDVVFEGMDGLIPTKNEFLGLEWNYTALPQEQNLDREKQKSSIYWKETGESVDHLGVGKSKDESVSADIDWISYKQQFFNTTLLSNSLFDYSSFSSTINMEDSVNIAIYEAKTQVLFDANSNNEFEMEFYFGPNDFRLLKKEVGRDLKEVVELSYDFFLFNWVKYINKWIIIPIFNVLEKFIGNYGIIILIMTLLIKMALMPLTFKSYVSTAKQRLLKPQLDELKEKYKDDQQKYATAQMQLYQKTGVSMFGGCLPTLLQMPILLAMFYFFPSSIELRQESFLWAQDLSTFDTIPWLTWKTAIPVLGNHLSPFTILMTISSLLMAKFNTQMQAQPSQPGMEMMKYMPYIFPFFLLFLFNSWPSALTYYYFLSNMITFGQQFAIKRFFIDEDKLLAQIEANKKKPVKKKSGFAAKLEDIYKQQQQAQQAQKKKKK